MRKKVSIFKVKTTSDLLTLMDIYLTEWRHRDSLLWKQVFVYFYAILIVVMFPFVDILGVSFEEILPRWIFSAIGIVLSVMFLIVSKGYADRLKSIGDTYNRLIKMLPVQYRRNVIKSSMRLSYFITYIMFGLLIIISVITLYINICISI